ncbi:MAG: ankyrin repeat domain-containing protein [Alphaproteobacteria bacterium]|nr:ankyrin repeat domain-containing protein [Alphaproteobacteria bacterium]
MTRTRFNRNAAPRLLHRFAAEPQSRETVSVLLQGGAEVYALDDNGDTAVHAAAQAGNMGMLHALFDYDRSGIDAAGAAGTALGIAAAANDSRTLHIIVDAGADLNATDKNGLTPLMRAWQAGAYETMRHLLQLGADIGAVNLDHKNILHMAAGANDVAALKMLLAEGGAAHLQTRMPSADKLTPLHAAVREGAEDAARLLIAAGASVNIPDAQNMTPLHTAAARDDVGMIYTLVCEGHAEIGRVENPAGYTALHTAIINKNEAAMRALCDLGADAHQMDTEKRTPLNIAGWNGFLPAIKYLMEEIPAETSEEDALQSRTQALYDAVFYSHDDAAEYLIASGKLDLNRPTRNGDYVLIAALQSGTSDMAEKLIAAGADVNARNKNGMTPLLNCVMRNQVVAANLLLLKGGDPNFSTPSTRPLHAAIARDYPFMVTLLLEHGANPLQPDGFGRGALDLARQQGRANMVGEIEKIVARLQNMKNDAPEGPASP